MTDGAKVRADLSKKDQPFAFSVCGAPIMIDATDRTVLLSLQ